MRDRGRKGGKRRQSFGGVKRDVVQGCQGMQRQEKLSLSGSILLVAFGAFVILGGVINFVERPAEHPLGSTLALLIIAGLAPIVWGLVLFRNTRRKAARRQREDMERAVLQLAAERQGVLSVTDVATYTALSLEEAQEVLNQLNLKNFNAMDVSEEGIILYKFHGYTD
jgi:hypothetical protein